MSVGHPMKAHVIDLSLNESIVMSFNIIASVNHHQLIDLISFTMTDNHNDRLRLTNQKPNTTASLAPRMFGM